MAQEFISCLLKGIVRKVHKDTEVGLDLLLKFEVGNKNSVNNSGMFPF